MAILKAWFVEEVDLQDGTVGHRQSTHEFDTSTGEWVVPAGIEGEALKEWNLVMSSLSKIQGRDFRQLVHPVALRDHCLAKQKGKNKPWRRGSGEKY